MEFLLQQCINQSERWFIPKRRDNHAYRNQGK